MGNGSATEFVQSYSNNVSSSVGVRELVLNFNLYTLSGMKPLLRCFSNLRMPSSVRNKGTEEGYLPNAETPQQQCHVGRYV